MLPGALGTKETDFLAQFDYLDPSAYTLVSWDPPGYGHADPALLQRSWTLDMLERDAEVVVALMKHIGSTRFSILGYSDGANTAFLIAAKYPEMVYKVIAVGGNAFLDSTDIRIYEELRDINTWDPQGRNLMVSSYGQAGFLELWNKWCDTMALIYKERGGDICKEELKLITAPVLIVHGKNDTAVPLHHAYHLAAHLVSGDLWTISDAGHDPHLTHAHLFNGVMTLFLQNR
ncbi:hypothetical protein RvY_08883-2 [Ramazzottius varieornatus]|uniref:AB hydrolase-1 domain-containing protein n=1 Tax=Ramazzottius varieornatus TaxID=947166 RepID=A0A1D1V7G7_RAMVA|nr:hypothetical protein RvY_08883-2 [Ramazzottius varieornatus]